MILESEMGTASNHAGVGARQFERQHSGQVKLSRILLLLHKLTSKKLSEFLKANKNLKKSRSKFLLYFIKT